MKLISFRLLKSHFQSFLSLIYLTSSNIYALINYTGFATWVSRTKKNFFRLKDFFFLQNLGVLGFSLVFTTNKVVYIQIWTAITNQYFFSVFLFHFFHARPFSLCFTFAPLTFLLLSTMLDLLPG
jgi:hypothetical protein